MTLTEDCKWDRRLPPENSILLKEVKLQAWRETELGARATGAEEEVGGRRSVFPTSSTRQRVLVVAGSLDRCWKRGMLYQDLYNATFVNSWRLG